MTKATMQEIDYSELNPGIRETVRFMREHGYETVDSGDGQTHDHKCGRDYPYVTALVPIMDIAKAASKLESLFMEHHDIDFTWVGQDGPEIEASYQPGSVALVDVRYINDSMLKEQ